VISVMASYLIKHRTRD